MKEKTKEKIAETSVLQVGSFLVGILITWLGDKILSLELGGGWIVMLGYIVGHHIITHIQLDSLGNKINDLTKDNLGRTDGS